MAVTYPAGINGFLTPFGRQLLLESLFRERLAIPQVWVALLTRSAQETHDGNTMPEMSSVISAEDNSGLEVMTGYQRAYYQSYDARGALRWTQSSNRSIYNADQIIFPQADARWGLIRGWALMDQNKGGNIIAAGDTDLIVDTGDQVVIEPSSLGLVILAGI